MTSVDRSQDVESSLWKRLWICRKRDLPPVNEWISSRYRNSSRFGFAVMLLAEMWLQFVLRGWTRCVTYLLREPCSRLCICVDGTCFTLLIYVYYLTTLAVTRDACRRNAIPKTVWWFNPLTPNGHYSGRTAPLTSSRCILNIYSTNVRTEYFKRAA
jgi:hypothetical protein